MLPADASIDADLAQKVFGRPAEFDADTSRHQFDQAMTKIEQSSGNLARSSSILGLLHRQTDKRKSITGNIASRFDAIHEKAFQKCVSPLDVLNTIYKNAFQADPHRRSGHKEATA